MYQIDWALVLEYLKVALAWPPIVALMLFAFFFRFKPKLEELIERIAKVESPLGSATFAERKQATATPPIFDLPGGPALPHGEANVVATPTPVEAGNPVQINKAVNEKTIALYPNVNTQVAIEWMATNPGPALDDYVEKIFELHCERTFNIIFGTQVQALEFLQGPAAGLAVPGADLMRFYDEHVKLAGKAERTFLDFVNFLVGQQFVRNSGTADGPLYQITDAGKAFLQHIKRFYPQHWHARVL